MTEQQKDTVGKTFQLQRVYLKDLSFEAPGAPDIFLEEWKPQLSVQLSNNARKISDDRNEYEVVVGVTVTAKRDDTVIYLVEVKQAGIFSIIDIDGDELEHLLGAYCPTILYPYARESVTNAVERGSFPQLLLQPVNFDQLYQQSKQQVMEEQSSASKH